MSILYAAPSRVPITLTGNVGALRAASAQPPRNTAAHITLTAAIRDIANILITSSPRQDFFFCRSGPRRSPAQLARHRPLAHIDPIDELIERTRNFRGLEHAVAGAIDILLHEAVAPAGALRDHRVR